MRLTKIIQDYFTFSKKERNGIIVLLVIVILIAIGNRIIFLFENPGSADVEKFLAEIAEFEKIKERKKKTLSLFIFDPNLIDSLSLDSLLLPVQIKHNLLKFRVKGGTFSEPGDFRKIYGMNDSIYSEIQKFIRIENIMQKTKPYDQQKKQPVFYQFDPNTCTETDWGNFGLSKKQIKTIERYSKSIGGFKNKEQFSKTYGIEKQIMDSLLMYMEIKVQSDSLKAIPENKYIELNSTDSLVLKKLPGIGTVLSRRIIRYRDLLGGYYSIDQLQEVYGLKTEVFQEIKNNLVVDTLRIRSLNINFSSDNELSAHPYITKIQGEKIVSFRSENGIIKNIEILYKEEIFEKDEFEKIRPYIRAGK